MSWLTGAKPAYAAVILSGDEAATPDVAMGYLRARCITNVDVQQLPEGGGCRPWVLRVGDPHARHTLPGPCASSRPTREPPA